MEYIVIVYLISAYLLQSWMSIKFIGLLKTIRVVVYKFIPYAHFNIIRKLIYERSFILFFFQFVYNMIFFKKQILIFLHIKFYNSFPPKKTYKEIRLNIL